MDYETAVGIYRAIRATRLDDLRQDLIDTAVRYARLRVDWLVADPDRQAVIGADRAACHNSLIVACDVLARNMRQGGEDASWRDALGPDRKRIGDFACVVHCVLGLSAR